MSPYRCAWPAGARRGSTQGESIDVANLPEAMSSCASSPSRIAASAPTRSASIPWPRRAPRYANMMTGRGGAGRLEPLPSSWPRICSCRPAAQWSANFRKRRSPSIWRPAGKDQILSLYLNKVLFRRRRVWPGSGAGEILFGKHAQRTRSSRGRHPGGQAFRGTGPPLSRLPMQMPARSAPRSCRRWKRPAISISIQGPAAFRVTACSSTAWPVRARIEAAPRRTSVGGNDFVVSLGMWTPNMLAAAGGLKAAEEGTLMHELGHTLGLEHGGRRDNGSLDETNCKPNYQSVMNYAWQVPNVDPGRPLDYQRFGKGDPGGEQPSTRSPSRAWPGCLVRSSTGGAAPPGWSTATWRSTGPGTGPPLSRPARRPTSTTCRASTQVRQRVQHRDADQRTRLGPPPVRLRRASPPRGGRQPRRHARRVVRRVGAQGRLGRPDRGDEHRQGGTRPVATP